MLATVILSHNKNFASLRLGFFKLTIYFLNRHMIWCNFSRLYRRALIHCYSLLWACNSSNAKLIISGNKTISRNAVKKMRASLYVKPSLLEKTGYSFSMYGYLKSVGGIKFSFMVRGETHRIMLNKEPALSFVPEPLAPPKGC